MKAKLTFVLALSAAGAGLSVLAVLSLATPSAVAVSTMSFVLDDAASLAAGELDGTAVLSNGSVVVGAEVRRLAMEDVPVAWSFVRGPNGTVYVGTGNEGKIFRLRGDDLSLYAETGQLLVSALALAPDGTLYAGTLPEGRIFQIDTQGAAAELTRPEGVEHVWDLAWDSNRNRLFAATGPEGQLYSIDAQGRADIFWDSDAAHVMALDLDTDGAVYAGTSGDAIVVRLTGPGRAEVVYDFPGNEITALDVHGGVLAVAANEFPTPPAARSTKTKSTQPARPRPGKGRLWRVAEDGRAVQIYAHDDGHFATVQLAPDGTVYAGGGKDGRIYRVGPDRTSATWIDVDERQILAIDLLGEDPLFVTGDAGAIYRVLGSRPRNAIWTSKVLDARFLSRFGALSWRGSGAIRFQTRSGNREEPDATWSEWSASLATPGPIRSSAARFLQVRAHFPEGGDATLRAVTAYYLPQNQGAQLTNVRVHVGSSSSSKNKSKRGTKAAQTLPAPSSHYKLKWDVANDDGDRLRFRLRFREESQRVWRNVLRESEELTTAEYTWDTSAVPDGWYVIEVVASDELANPEGLALQSTATSEPILIDNHAPTIEGLRVNGGRVVGRAVDGLGPIARLEFAVDGGDWRLFFPSDGLLDAPDERFEFDPQVSGGPHIVAVRATDAGGNVVTAETTTRAR